MLGLRFFVCQQCETVFAEPEEPVDCGCSSRDSIEEITADVQTEPYFTRLLATVTRSGTGNSSDFRERDE